MQRDRDPVEVLRPALAARYEIERETARGNAATVYLARDLRHDRPVALKVLRAESETPTIDEARFAREIKLLARLQHPFILPLHDSGHVEDVLYYVSPYVMGESLRQRLERERKLPLEDALRIAREAADALDCAHRNGVIHRDIKPENILLSGGHPIVADFGVARAFDAFRGPRLTQPGAVALAIDAYKSPEQLRGDREPDNRSDIFSLGCVIYEMLTGASAFGGRTGLARRFNVPPKVSSKRSVPEHVNEAVARAMAKEPEERFPTVRELGRALSA